MATPRPAPPPSKAIKAPQPDREPNDFIGEFERGKEIGRGSFANVYLAKHRKKKSYAAVKVVIMARIHGRLKVGLDSEIAILRAMNHPHVVALFATQKTPMYYYIVMEYCQLSDLSQFCKKRHQIANYPETADIFKRYPNPEYGGLNEVLCRHFFKQLASALEYLRLCQFVHRDIKPQNLLLTPAPVDLRRRTSDELPLTASDHGLDPMVGVQSLPMLKLADFGFARELEGQQMAETLCGSPLYMAPEILHYEKYDSRSDLWSAGVVLYELMVGRAPFRAPNHIELLKKIEKANDEIPFDPRLSIGRDMKGLLRGLLKKSPLDRYSYADMVADPVVSGDIPGLTREDKPLLRYRSGPPSDDTGVAKMVVDEDSNPTQAPEQVVQPRKSQESVAGPSSRKSSDQELKTRPQNAVRRQSSSGSQGKEEAAPEMQRHLSQREQPKQRRPSIVSHATAPARQDLLAGTVATQPSAPRMERRPSRTSPLAGPPMVREPSAVEVQKATEKRASREARERTAQDMAFEKEYVMVEKRAVEINAFADELEAKRGSTGPAMERRATTQGRPGPVAGVEPSSPSRAMQMVSTRPQGTHQRGNSFERRYGPGPQSATTLISKAITAANVRLFGVLGTSPPFSKGASPPGGYSAFPTYPTPQGALLLTEGGDGKTPMDEDTKIVRTMEDAAHRSDVIFGFAEVKYRQLVPATPSTAPDALGIQQIGAQEKPMTASGEDEDKDMTNIAVVGVAEEALVLYVKTLAVLAKTINLAAYWWNKQARVETGSNEPASRPTSTTTAEVGKRMNNVVQWARGRFNECLEKSEVVGRRLQTAQRELPAEHPGHPNNQSAASNSASGAITTSAEHIHITTGITAEKLMFDRAVEMSRAAALAELVGENLNDCELGYVTAIMLLEAVLESDDEPLMRKPSAKKDKAADEAIAGMETEDRQTVVRRELPSSSLGILC